jgi:hypothetical protein
MFNGLIESIIQELNYNGLMRKQASINRLFPTFPQRVRKVASRGGVTLVEKLPHTWHFVVASVTTADKLGIPGLQFDVYIRFVNLDEVIKKYAPDKRFWNKEGTAVNYNFLSTELMHRVDIETDCSCPADLYWGAEYIKTQRHAQYDHGEFRPPDIRNPHQYGALCKHGELVFEALPMYVGTFAGFLKEFWSEEIENAFDTAGEEYTDVQRAAAEEVSRKEEEQMKKKGKGATGAGPRPGEGGRTTKLTPSEEQDEESFRKGETPEGEPIEGGEDIPVAKPVQGGKLGNAQEKPASKTGKQNTRVGTKPANKTGSSSTRSGTKPIGTGNKSATKSNTTRGTK